MQTVSYSRMSLYLRCPYAHYLRYVENLTPIKPARPLQFGSDFHKLLEHRASKKELKQVMENIRETYYDMPANWQTDLGENYVDDIKTIFMDYQKVYKHNPNPDKTEEPFEIEIGKVNGESIAFVGVIDGLYRIGDKFIIEEHKTFSRKPDVSALVMNTQKCLYAKAAQLLWGILPDEVMWDYIKSTPASEPVWLEKSQRFSTAKSEHITPYSFMRAVKSRGLDPEEYKKVAAEYKPNIQNFFFRLQLDYIPDMVEAVWEDYLYVANEIVRNGNTNKVHNMTKDCSWCEFYPICYAEMTSGNVDYVKRKEYKER